MWIILAVFLVVISHSEILFRSGFSIKHRSELTEYLIGNFVITHPNHVRRPCQKARKVDEFRFRRSLIVSFVSSSLKL